jgi:periplasmic divalent cation tolerance protein
MSPALLVFTTLPDQETAENLGRRMVEARLAACVNVMSPCRSIYRWQGAIEEDGEVPLIIKTSADCYRELETWLRQHHPYELPEIVAVNIANGLPDYLAWIGQETNQ